MNEDAGRASGSTAQTCEVRRETVVVSFDETASFTETYGFTGSQGKVVLEGQRLIPRGIASDTILLFMHPASPLHQMPLPRALAGSGHHVICCASRYARNDTALIMEKVVADLAAYMRCLRETLGYRRVVLAGWSGGGSLACYYQSQAEHPSVRETPAGDPYDLTRLDLPPADALMFIAAHTGRARILSEWIDPSVRNEFDPDDRDPEFDLYGDHPGVRPPFDPAFVAAFRDRQRQRIQGITAQVLQRLEQLRRQAGAETERPFLVHRTMADPRFLDPALEPNARKPGWCYLGNPETVNSGPVGLARFTTLRAWLSQWSPDHSQADAECCIGAISVPLLFIENGADDAVPRSHMQSVYAAARSSDKHYQCIEGASHYYRDQPQHLRCAVRVIADWLQQL